MNKTSKQPEVSNPKSHSIHYVLVVIAVFLCSINTVSANPLLWEVSSHNGGGKGWLFGSIHLGKQDLYPLPDNIEKAFAASDMLVVEVDLSITSPQEISALLLDAGRYEKGKTLKSQLSPKVWGKLVALFKKEGLDISQIESMKPWLASIQLVLLQANRAGYEEALGLDNYFIQKATEQKRISALESLPQQFGFFDLLPPKDQETLLLQTLEDFELGEAYLEELVKYWRNGDQEALTSLVLTPIKQSAQNNKLYTLLFKNRNLSMSEKISKLIKAGHKPFVVVGMGHLLGEDSIQSYLDINHELTVQLSP